MPDHGSPQRPLLPEERLHQVRASGFQYPARDLRLRMEQHAAHTPVATFLIEGPEDDATDMPPGERTGTHHAGLQRHVKGAIVQVFASDMVCRGGDGLHLCMGRHVVQALHQVMASRDDAAVGHDHCADRHFIRCKGLLRLAQRMPHPVLVIGGRKRCCWHQAGAVSKAAPVPLSSTFAVPGLMSFTFSCVVTVPFQWFCSIVYSMLKGAPERSRSRCSPCRKAIASNTAPGLCGWAALNFRWSPLEPSRRTSFAITPRVRNTGFMLHGPQGSRPSMPRMKAGRMSDSGISRSTSSSGIRRWGGRVSRTTCSKRTRKASTFSGFRMRPAAYMCPPYCSSRSLHAPIASCTLKPFTLRALPPTRPLLSVRTIVGR